MDIFLARFLEILQVSCVNVAVMFTIYIIQLATKLFPILNKCLSVQQMDDAVYTFEQILHQSLEDQGPEGLCKSIQRCQDRVIKVRQTGKGWLLAQCTP